MGLFGRKKLSIRGKKSDKHTYFITSPFHGLFEVLKLHGCTWLYEGGSECVELGLHIHFKEDADLKVLGVDETPSGCSRRILTLTFWGAWIEEKVGAEIVDLYESVSRMENARFIFNDDCTSVACCSEWNGASGYRLQFASGTKFCVVPVIASVKTGRIVVSIEIPENFNLADDLYIRFCAKIPESSLSFHCGDTARRIYAYNININQMRNAPEDKDFRSGDRCVIKSVYAIHIFPVKYIQTFTDRRAFEGIRILESDRYNEYVKDVGILQQNIAQDSLMVSFNKRKDDSATAGTEFSFFSVFERDIIGRKQVQTSVAYMIGGAILGVVLTLVVGWMRANCNFGTENIGSLTAEPTEGGKVN